MPQHCPLQGAAARSGLPTRESALNNWREPGAPTEPDAQWRTSICARGPHAAISRARAGWSHERHARPNSLGVPEQVVTACTSRETIWPARALWAGIRYTPWTAHWKACTWPLSFHHPRRGGCTYEKSSPPLHPLPPPPPGTPTPPPHSALDGRRMGMAGASHHIHLPHPAKESTTEQPRDTWATACVRLPPSSTPSDAAM